MLSFMYMYSYLRCLIVAPNTIHMGVEETVSVQLHGATKETSIQLYFQDQISKKIVSENKSIIFNNDNNYQAIVKLKVRLYTSYLVAVWNCVSQLPMPFLTRVPQVDRSLYESTEGQKYVQLAATSNYVFGLNAKKASIFLSTKKGYIFIQTDKPIYNPGETGMILILLLLIWFFSLTFVKSY